MKKIILYILLTIGSLIPSVMTPQVGVGPAPYCMPIYFNQPCNQFGPSNSPGNSVNDFINSYNTAGATFNIVNNNSGCNAQILSSNMRNYRLWGCQYYMICSPGQVITSNFQSGIIFAQGCAVFVDWNNDGVYNQAAFTGAVPGGERVTQTGVTPPAGVFGPMPAWTVPTVPAGTYRMRVRCVYSSSGNFIQPCTSYSYGETEEYYVYVNSSPSTMTINLTSNSPVCIGGVVSLNASILLGPGAGTCTPNTYTYTWTGPMNYTSSVLSPTFTATNVLQSGVYTLNVTPPNGCGCNGTNTIQVWVNPNPSTSITNNGPICQGSSLNFNNTVTGGGSMTYSWTGPNNFVANTPSISFNPAQPSNTGLYSFTVTSTFTNGGQCKAFSSSSAAVVPVAQVNTTPSYTQCQGTNINLNAFVNGATSYTWNGPNSYTSGLSNPTLLNSTPAISGDYSVTAYFASNQTTLVCTSTAVSNVSIVPMNPVSISPAQNVCQGSNNIILTASASANPTYNWFGPNNFNTQQQTIPFNNIQPFVSGNYVVNAVWSIGTVSCTTSNTTNITVVPVNTVTVVPQLNVCENDNAILTATAQGATSYTWTGPNGFNVNQPVTYFQNLNPNWNGVYTVTASFTNGNLICFSSNQTVLQVKPKINFSLTPIGKLCYNQPLNVNGPNGATSYSWVGPGFTSSLQNLSLPNTTTANIGTYSLTVDLNGCKTYGSIFVDVQTPISWGNIVQPQPICKGQTFTISAQAQGGSGNYAYNWNPVTYILGPNGDTQTGVAVSTTIYNIDVFDIACPYYKIYNTIVLNVNQPPIPKLTVPNYSCEPYCQIFNSKVNYEAATVLYTFNGSKQVMGDSVKVCLSSGLYNVNVTTFGLNGCKGSFDYPKLITVYPKPEADFTWSPQEPNTVSENFVTFYPKEQNNESYYSWFLSETDTSNSLIPSRYFYEPGKYPISLLLTNKFGCKDTSTKVIEIIEEDLFYLPNSFTPNGDGSNDIFAPKGLGFKSYTLAIFDRWGQVILSPSNNSQGWDGKFKGDICQDGVYVYQVMVLDKDGKRHTRTGHVTLMK